MSWPIRKKYFRAVEKLNATREIAQQLAHHEALTDVVDEENYNPFTDYAQPTAKELNLTSDGLEILAATQQTAVPSVNLASFSPTKGESSLDYHSRDAQIGSFGNLVEEVVSPIEICHSEVIGNLDD
tara:strand:+ start:5492 stop:5872 length:381 start_codon:yes stop_codon:yes gene_type:complete